MAIRLKNIEDIICSFGILGSVFGYGDLTVESAGTYGIMIFKAIPRPKKVKSIIERQLLYSNLKKPNSSS